MGACNCSLFCCTLLYVHSSFAIILMGERELVALLSLSFWCLVIVMWLFLAVPCVRLQFVIVVFPGHTHLLLLLVLSPLYEGRSICNENSPVNPKVLYLHTSQLLLFKPLFLG